MRRSPRGRCGVVSPGALARDAEHRGADVDATTL
jgi:hypothetical protein